MSKTVLTRKNLAEICRNLRAGFEECCIRLQSDRRQEGQKIKTVLEERVDRIEILVQEVARLAVAQPALLKQKLSAQLAELLEGAPISEERLAQEAVLLVNRAGYQRGNRSSDGACENRAGTVGRQSDARPPL